MRLFSAFLLFLSLTGAVVYGTTHKVARVLAKGPGGTTPPLHPRYAIIDLGQGNTPIRIRNNGWILFVDADGNYHRWHGGVQELLTSGDPAIYGYGTDINEQGLVVGGYAPRSNASGAYGGGMYWNPSSSVGVQTPAPDSLPSGYNPYGLGNPSWGYPNSYFTAVSNRGDAYGSILAGFRAISFAASSGLAFYNANKWPNPIGFQRVPLSNSKPGLQLDAVDNHTVFFNWNNPSIDVARVNSAGRYIGDIWIPGQLVSTNNYWWVKTATQSPMIDGKVAPFYPTAINEAGDIVGGALGSSSLFTLQTDGLNPVGVGNGYPVAINDAKRHQRDIDGNPLPDVATPQILGYLFSDGHGHQNIPTLWEINDKLTGYVSEALGEKIPSNSGWSITSAVDVNDDGSIVGYGSYQNQGHGFVLLPVILTNLADSYRGSAFTAPATLNHNNQDTTIDFQAKYADATLDSISWIAANQANDSNMPQMPQLTVSIGTLLGATVEWKFQAIFHDRNGTVNAPGNPHRDFDSGDPNNHNPSSTVAPQDTVQVPSQTAGSRGSGDPTNDNGWRKIVVTDTANGNWSIYQDSDWLAQLSNAGFFGGDATLSVRIEDANGNIFLPEQDYLFRIAGENPIPQNCQNAIVSVYGGPKAPTRDPSELNKWFGFWFADALPQEETNGEGGRVAYNNFLDNGGQLKNKSRAWQGHQGRPDWNDDGNQKGTGGYGLFQHTYAPEDQYYPAMPRDWIWNWQSNVTNYQQHLNSKYNTAMGTYNGLVAQYSKQHGDIPNRLSFSGLEALIITYNNGGGGKTQYLRLPGVGKRLTCWLPVAGGWKFLPNGQKYVDKVNPYVSH